MNALLNYVWGVSPAVDRVWEHVTGMRPLAATRKPLLALQAFIDESCSPNIFVLGGGIATAEAWGQFAKDWEELLPFATQDKNGVRNFKYSSMIGAGPDRSKYLPIFGNVLQRHAVCAISFHFYLDDLERAKRRIKILGMPFIDWGDYNNPYTLALNALVAILGTARSRFAELVPPDQPIQLIFDERSESEKILAGWNKSIEHLPPATRSIFASKPRFEKDHEFLPLQGADLIAGYVRHCQWDSSLPQSRSHT